MKKANTQVHVIYINVLNVMENGTPPPPHSPFLSVCVPMWANVVYIKKNNKREI